MAALPIISLGRAVAAVVADLDIRRRCQCPGARYGLWSDTTDPCERVARLRSLRTLVRVFAGPAGTTAEAALAAAEIDPAMVGTAVDALDRLPALTLRRVLSTYAGIHRPSGGGRS